MRIAVVVTSPFGGLLHYAVQMADGLAGQGHDAHVIAPRGNEMVGRTGRALMRDILVPPVTAAETPHGALARFVRRAGIGVRLMTGWGQILRETARGRYDAMIVSTDVSLAPAAAGFLTMTGLPRRPLLAGVCHNVRIFNRWGGDELYHEPPHLLWLFRRTYPRLDVVFVHGETSQAEFAAFWPPSNLAVIAHGDERIFGSEPPPPSAEERILFFGDWRKVKGLDHLMEAFDELVARRPSVSLTIAGSPAPGDFDPDLVRRWAAGHGERVTVIDRYVDVEEVAPIFGAARVVVTPYHTGSQSGVIHVAQTMARPVVTTDVGDLGRAVEDGVTGLVVAPRDRPALVDALDRVVGDAELAARMGAAAHERVRSAASWETVAEQVEAALAGALSRRRGRRAA